MQLYGYMLRRAHVTGILSTYANSWLLMADMKGGLQISDPVKCTQEATSDSVTVTEVSLNFCMCSGHLLVKAEAGQCLSKPARL